MIKPPTKTKDVNKRIACGRSVILAEAAALKELAGLLNNQFSAAIDLILNLKSYLIVVGVGKSGHIGTKIAASFASTGTPSFFLHPTEASHGDLGMVAPGCVILAISNSGESRELRDVLTYSKSNDIPVIGITRSTNSTLVRFSQVVLHLPDTPEVCINGLAPTTSTTNTLAIGDALTVAVMSERGFSSTDFGRHHPGGKLGLKLQTAAEWLELHPHDIPTVSEFDNMEHLTTALSKGLNGCVAVVDNTGKMVGLITDGDLRRAMDEKFFSKITQEIMVKSPLTVAPEMLMGDLIKSFSEKRISNAFIVENGTPLGVIHIKTLLQEGYL